MNFQFGMNIYNTNKINKMFYINYRKGASPVLHQYDVCGRSLHGRRQYNCWNSSICVSGRRRVPNYLGNWHLVFIFANILWNSRNCSWQNNRWNDTNKAVGWALHCQHPSCCHGIRPSYSHTGRSNMRHQQRKMWNQPRHTACSPHRVTLCYTGGVHFGCGLHVHSSEK